jgi:hypothetical protein
MKKSVIFVIGFVVLSSLICIGVVVFNFFTRGCLSWICAPEREFRISDLELPSNLFPEGTIVNHINPLSDEFGTLEDGTQSIYWENGNGRAGYTIYRYSNVRGAEKYYDLHKRLFMNSDTGEEWKSPDNSSFSSRTANITYVGCGYWSGKSRDNCTMVAQYQEYVVVFSATLDTKMTFDQFEKILLYIDDQFSSLLYP